MKKILLCFFILFFLLFFFPYIPSLREGAITRSSYMKSSSEALRYQWVPLSQVSSHLQKAVICAEDARFYEHSGIDYHEMKHSIMTNIRRRSFSRGFSTITMQVARNLYLSREKYLWRKAAEIWIALKMEWMLPKKRILEIYLNIAEWGKGIYGAEAASQYYFKKRASELTLKEASFLAAILPNPKKWGRFPPGSYVSRRIRFIERRLGGSFTPELLDSETVQEPVLQDLEDRY